MFPLDGASRSTPSVDESFAIIAGGLASHHQILETMSRMLDFLCRRYTIDNFDVWTPEFIEFAWVRLADPEFDSIHPDFADRDYCDRLLKAFTRTEIETLIIDFLTSKSESDATGS